MFSSFSMMTFMFVAPERLRPPHWESLFRNVQISQTKVDISWRSSITCFSRVISVLHPQTSSSSRERCFASQQGSSNTMRNSHHLGTLKNKSKSRKGDISKNKLQEGFLQPDDLSDSWIIISYINSKVEAIILSEVLLQSYQLIPVTMFSVNTIWSQSMQKHLLKDKSREEANEW